MEPTRIIAIRHGETAWNVEARVQGQLDIGLNDTGLRQARRVAWALLDESIAAVYTSDLARARQTASEVAQMCGREVLADAGLRERAFGRFEGQTFAGIEAALPDQAQRWRRRDPEFAPEGGESLLTFRERILRTAARIAQRHPGQQVVMVAHGGVMDVLYRAATGQELQAPRTWELGNAAINRLLWTPQGFTLVGWADTRHLGHRLLDEAAA
jgi:probable phosphoglycerate mutase